MLLGSHVSLKGKEMLLGSAKEAHSYGANVFMVYTGAPQNTRRRPLEEFCIEEAHQYMADHELELLTVHAPYIVNLANTTKPGYQEFAVDFLKEEVRRAVALGATQLTLHPGAHVGAGVEVGIEQLIKGLNQVIDPDQPIQIALETMAGKGTELGSRFEELAWIIQGVDHSDRLSVTFDTCHVFDAGYDLVEDLDGVLAEFDRIVGLDRIQVLHINDSKNEIASHKDRHANIGQGQIGFDTLNRLVHEERFSHLPKLLETPWVELEAGSKTKLPPYGAEIRMFRQQQYHPQLLEEIRSQAPFK